MFLCKRVPGDGASEWSSRQHISRAVAIVGEQLPCARSDTRRGRAAIDGGSRTIRGR